MRRTDGRRIIPGPAAVQLRQRETPPKQTNRITRGDVSELRRFVSLRARGVVRCVYGCVTDNRLE